MGRGDRGGVSEVVDAERVSEAGLVDGLVTPLSSTATESPAVTDAPLKITHVAITPDWLQFPTSLLVVVSVTAELTTVLKSVPVGNVTVILLPDAPSRPPVTDVTNATVYDVRAPTAADGGESVTVTLVTWDAWATPARPPSNTSRVIAVSRPATWKRERSPRPSDR